MSTASSLSVGTLVTDRFVIVAKSIAIVATFAWATPMVYAVDSPAGVCMDIRGCDSAPAATPGPSGPSPEQVRQQRERMRQKAKAWSTDEAMDYFDRKDWDNAIRSFEEALDRDPDDPDLNDWLKRAKAGKAKAQMALPPRPAPNNDSRVVDARSVPSGLPKSMDDAITGAYSNAPPGVSERVRKGFQAVMVRDWKVAKAWFEDALNHDPGNANLRSLVNIVAQSPGIPRPAMRPRPDSVPARHTLSSLDANVSTMSAEQARKALDDILDEHFLRDFR